jgi:hypothetical protein
MERATVISAQPFETVFTLFDFFGNSAATPATADARPRLMG